MKQKLPNDELADDVIRVLLKKKLIQDKRKDELRTALTSGNARAEDWRIWAEDFAREETKDGENDTAGKSNA